MESSKNPDKEYVILKFGEEGEEIKYLKNGALHIADDAPTEIIVSDELKTLNTISLSYCVWKDCKIKLPKTVKTLRIYESYIGIPNFLDNFPNLEEFGVFETTILDLYQLKTLITLKNLTLREMGIKKIDMLSNLKILKYLDLSMNSINCIEGLENLQYLSTLDLSNNKIERIENLDHLTKLKVLDLSRNQIKKIEGLENLTNLQFLDLSENKIKKIEGLKSLTKLEDLNLKGYSFPFLHLSQEEAKTYFRDLKNLKILNTVNYPENRSYSFSLIR
jgi:internalin A